MFNRKKPQQTPPRELTPWELAQQNSPRVEQTVPEEPVKKVKKKRNQSLKRRNQSHKVLRMQHS